MSDEYKGAIAIAFEVIGNEKYMMPTDARLILAHALIAMNNVRLAGPARLELPSQLWLAQWFHDTYERLAPEYGYVTRNETRVFDPFSPNGKLMIAVCKQLREALDVSRATTLPLTKEK